ncbi:hypothetical protein BC829DRAFT_395410 [Chytridium lagenaria]|nr:hypothetical protein BC829DRAFT_395410 [Chytridium lagenaria]
MLDLLAALPFEITAHAATFLHPYEVRRLMMLSRRHRRACNFGGSFVFAHANLRHAYTDCPSVGVRGLADVKHLDWINLGPFYFAAHLLLCSQVSEETLPGFCKDVGGHIELYHHDFTTSALQILRDVGQLERIPEIDGAMELLACIKLEGFFAPCFQHAGSPFSGNHMKRWVLSASFAGQTENVRMILQDPRLQDEEVSEIINRAVVNAGSEGHLDLVQILMQDWRMDLSDRGEFLMEQAMSYDNDAFVRLLLSEKRINPCSFTVSVVAMAILYGHFEIAYTLLSDPRIDPSLERNRAIEFASAIGHIGLVQILLADSRVNPGVTKALQSACHHGHIDVVKALLAHPKTNPSRIRNDALRKCSRVDVASLLLADPRLYLNFQHGKLLPTLCSEFISSEVAARVLRHVLESGDQDMVMSACYDPISEWMVHVAQNATNDELAEDLARVLLEDRRVDAAIGDCEALRVAKEREFFKLADLLQNNQKS